MSFTEKKFVAIHCDECDEQYEPEDGSAYYTDKDDADDDASSDGWQLDGDEKPLLSATLASDLQQMRENSNGKP